MGRAGRYTLSVMAWVAAYAGWSSLIGLVVAAVTGDRPRDVSTGASAVMTVVGPLVPTLVALWFNDWARDGFPTREQKRAAAAARAAGGETPREVPVVLQQPVHVTPLPAEPAPAAPAPAAPAAAAGGTGTARRAAARTAAPAPRPEVPVVPAHPLGVPAAAPDAGTAGAAGSERFPVAPLLRDDLDRG